MTSPKPTSPDTPPGCVLEPTVTRSCTRRNSRCGPSAGARSRSATTCTTSTTSSPSSSPQTAPALLACHGVGVDTAAILLVAAGDNPERIRNEAAWAHLCGVAPLDASSGKHRRHRLSRAGNRQANHALWRIVFTRMGTRPPHPRLRRAAHRRRTHQTRDHARPEALRRTRDLPAAPAQLNHVLGWRPDPITARHRHGLSFERSVGRHPNPSRPDTAWPNKSSPSTRVAHHWSASTVGSPLTNIGASIWLRSADMRSCKWCACRRRTVVLHFAENGAVPGVLRYPSRDYGTHVWDTLSSERTKRHGVRPHGQDRSGASGDRPSPDRGST